MHILFMIQMAKPSGRRRTPQARKPRRSVHMVFRRKNYLLLLIGVAAVVAGYAMMRIDNQVEGFVSLYIAPLIILGGYLEIIWAILVRPEEGKDSPNKPRPAPR